MDQIHGWRSPNGDDVATPEMHGGLIMGRFKDIAIQNQIPDEEMQIKRTRGRRARNRGNAFEREVAARLGGEAKRVGMYGSKTDVESPWLAAQTKVGGSYPERIDGWLRSINAKSDQLRAVILGDSPGAGMRRRTLIVLDFDDFCAWYANGADDATKE
jgi:hypothetical protein